MFSRRSSLSPFSISSLMTSRRCSNPILTSSSFTSKSSSDVLTDVISSESIETSSSMIKAAPWKKTVRLTLRVFLSGYLLASSSPLKSSALLVLLSVNLDCSPSGFSDYSSAAVTSLACSVSFSLSTFSTLISSEFSLKVTCGLSFSKNLLGVASYSLNSSMSDYSSIS